MPCISKLKCILSTITLLSGLLVSKAQTPTIRGSFYITNGLQFFNPVNFNETISSSGYPVLKSNFGSGFGGYGESKAWIFGGEGFYLQRSKSHDLKASQSFGGLGYFYVGKKLLNTSRWKIFPAVGVGAGGVTNSLITKTGSSTSIDQIINTQPNGSIFEIGSVLVHSAVSVELKFAKNYFVGTQCGYNFSLLGPTSWQAPGLNEDLTVKDTFGGFHLNVQVGFYLH